MTTSTALQPLSSTHNDVLSSPAGRTTLTVFAPDAFRNAWDRIVPAFMEATSIQVALVGGAAGGSAPEALNNRIAAGQHFDVALLPRGLMDAHALAGRLLDPAPKDLMRSPIGMCVAPGVACPSIDSAASLKSTLLEATSIALSTAGSGEYVAGLLLDRLGIVDQVRARCVRVTGASVGAYVTQGRAPIGFQQVSELLQVEGIRFGGVLPPQLQQSTLISAGIGLRCRNPESAQQFLAFLKSDKGRTILRASGVDPLMTT
jgi:molybdate transport system substrate-binding protein